MDSLQSIKTPLRNNVSAKLSSDNKTVQLIIRDLISNNDTTHVICGLRGIGKTWTAHIVAQMPLCKTNFSDGVIWIGLGSQRSLDYTQLRELYIRICSEIKFDDETTKPCFDHVLYSDMSLKHKTDKEKKREKKAMIQARNTMARCIASKSILICVDNLYDVEDVKYFQFHNYNIIRDKNLRTMVTTLNTPSYLDQAKIWQITNLHVDEARAFFLGSLKSSITEVPELMEKYSEMYRTCQGNPLSIKTLSHLIDDKVEGKNQVSLDNFAQKFVNVPIEPRIQIFNILEAAFTHSSLGTSFNKITWRCFAAFATVFKRGNCSRPCIAKSPTIALFSAIITRISKRKKSLLEKDVEKLLKFLVKLGIFNEIDGFDDGKIPRKFYQVSCDVYQEFGEQLSSSPQTHLKLNSLFVNKYTTMFSNSHAAFGSNEIDYFMLKWLPSHLRKCGDVDDQALTLPDYRFILERVKYMGAAAAARKHIDDAESFIRVSDVSSDILIPSYSAFSRVLESVSYDKENGNGSVTDSKDIIEAMWNLAISLFSHYYVKEGCQFLQKAREYDDSNDPMISIDYSLIQSLLESADQDHLNTVRALVKIGSVIAQSTRRQYAINIILLGLKGLIHCLGNECIEVARAHVFVGEVFYHDLALYEDAITQFRLSLPILVKVLGEENEEVYDAIILCGKTYVHLGALDTALEILEKIAPNLKGQTDMDVALKIASIHMMMKKYHCANDILIKTSRKTEDIELLKRIDDMREECKEQGRYTI